MSPSGAAACAGQPSDPLGGETDTPADQVERDLRRAALLLRLKTIGNPPDARRHARWGPSRARG